MDADTSLRRISFSLKLCLRRLERFYTLLHHYALYSSWYAGRAANNESSEVFYIIKPGRRVKIKGYRQ